MGLTNVMNVANTGLRTTQTGLDVVARNIANADTPGYTKKTLHTENLVLGNQGAGVRDVDVTRHVDSFLQKELRRSAAGTEAARTTDAYLSRLDALLGGPGDPLALDTVLGDFNTALQDLAAAPETYAAREGAVQSAQTLASQLRTLSDGVQGLRQMAEDEIAAGVEEINDVLGELHQLNITIAANQGPNGPSADLVDQRDIFLDRLSGLIGIDVREQPNGTVSVFTASGNTLLQNEPVTLSFDAQGRLGPDSLYDPDPSQRGVGTITLTSSAGYSLDFIEHEVVKTGKLGALVTLRDQTLVETQAQLDELAHGLALSLSSETRASDAATGGAGEVGLEIRADDLLGGDTLSLAFKDGATSRKVSFIRVDDPAALPLPQSATADPGDIVFGIDFSGGLANAATQMQTALTGLGHAVTVSLEGGDTVRFLDDGPAGTVDIQSLSGRITPDSAQGAGLGLGLFVDGGGGNLAYSASFDADGAQKTGFSARITVNAEVLANNELLVRHEATTAIGAPERPQALIDRLTQTQFAFDPQTGISNGPAPFTGSALAYGQRLMSYQGGQAERASVARQTQDSVHYAIEDKFNREIAVDVDQEMADLIALQNAFAANARVIQAVKEMFDVISQL